MAAPIVNARARDPACPDRAVAAAATISHPASAGTKTRPVAPQSGRMTSPSPAAAACLGPGQASRRAMGIRDAEPSAIARMKANWMLQSQFVACPGWSRTSGKKASDALGPPRMRPAVATRAAAKADRVATLNAMPARTSLPASRLAAVRISFGTGSRCSLAWSQSQSAVIGCSPIRAGIRIMSSQIGTSLP